MKVQVSIEADGVDAKLSPWLSRQVRRAAAAAGVNHGCLSVAVVNDVRMMKLHHQFSGEVGTTDVLTFDLREAPSSTNQLEGEIVVCFDEAQRQARSHGHTARDEALLYVVHGMLHLMGYDDHDPAAAARMHQREDQILTTIGIGPVYAPTHAR